MTDSVVNLSGRYRIAIWVVVGVLVLTAGAPGNPTINDALDKFGLTENTVVAGADTITYYLTRYQSPPSNLVVFIQGTDPFPLFFYRRVEGEVKLMRTFHADYELLDSTYAYAVVAKPGLAGIRGRDHFVIPHEYHEKNYREYRVRQIDLAIQDIVEKHLRNPNKVILYGHSEGAQIAAAVASENRQITHLGFWSGNVLNNFYEFILFERIAALKGEQSDSTAQDHIAGLLGWYQRVIDDPLSTQPDDWGYTNRRWSSYEQAPINDLLEVDIPIYACFATEDESTPVEAAYLLPVQFMRHRKQNLTFEVCVGCDHSYREEVDGEIVDHWNKRFADFIRWTEVHDSH